MRIVGGKHKGRRLAAPEGRDTRPTSDRARESLFNILAHSELVELDGARVVDAFAGTGGLGLEALSRGAAKVTFLELAGASVNALKTNIRTLDEEDRTEVVRGDATKPPPARGKCSLALLDPPYNSGLAGPCLTALAGQGWLEDDALCVVEVAAKEPFIPPEGFRIEDERVYGAARLVFLVRG